MKQLMHKYLKLTKRPLAGYKIFDKQSKIAKRAYLAMMLFVAIVIYYIIELLNVVQTQWITIEYIGVIFVILVVFPLLYIHKKTIDKVLLTHDALAKQNIFKRYKLLFYNDIKKVRQTRKNALIIRGKRKKFKVKMAQYTHDFNVLKTILTYEGHFKQKRKPYKLFFEGNDVEIQELSPSGDPVTSRLVERFHDDYKHVTPGFLNDIVMYNCEVQRVRFIDQKHVVFLLNHLDLKGDYPENTHFESMQTDDAMLLFQDVTHVEIFKIGKNKSDDIVLLGTSVSTLKKISKGAMVLEANFKPLDQRISTEMVLMQGSRKQKVRFVFKEVVAGFNELKKSAWFEKK